MATLFKSVIFTWLTIMFRTFLSTRISLITNVILKIGQQRREETHFKKPCYVFTLNIYPKLARNAMKRRCRALHKELVSSNSYMYWTIYTSVFERTVCLCKTSLL